MADEPTRPIEQELEQWAQQRRAEAGAAFELDPVQRRQLHEEVERVQAAGTPAPPRPLWLLLLPRLALGGALAGLLLLAVMHMGSRSQPAASLELAMQDKSDVPAAVDEAAALPAPGSVVPEPAAEADALAPMRVASPPVVAAAPGSEARSLAPEPAAPLAKAELKEVVSQNALTAEKRRTAVSRDVASFPTTQPKPTRSDASPVAAPAPTEAPIPAQAPTLSERYGVTVAGAGAKSRAGTVASGLPGAATAGRTGQVENGAATQLGQFAPTQRMRRNLNSPPQRVLAQFSLEQEGETVRVVDRDGSVYVGQTVPTVRLEEAADRSIGRALSAGTSAPSAEGFLFEVRGTNVTTGEPVVMRGVFRTQPTPAVEGSAEVGTGSRLQIAAPRLPEPAADVNGSR